MVKIALVLAATKTLRMAAVSVVTVTMASVAMKTVAAVFSIAAVVMMTILKLTVATETIVTKEIHIKLVAMEITSIRKLLFWRRLIDKQLCYGYGNSCQIIPVSVDSNPGSIYSIWFIDKANY